MSKFEEVTVKSEPSLCSLRWNYPIFNLSTAEVRTCCRTPSYKVDPEEFKAKGTDAFLNSKYLLQRRMELLKGVKHSDCGTCWDTEAKGFSGPREIRPEFIQHLQEEGAKYFKAGKASINVRQLAQATTIESPWLRAGRPYMVEVILSNLCNMKCTYCSRDYSSSWAEEDLKFNVQGADVAKASPKSLNPEIHEAFWTWLENEGMHSLQYFTILGGEPLINPELYPFLQRLMDLFDGSGRRPGLSIVTNLKTPKKLLDQFVKQLPDLQRIFDFDLNVSMESVGPRAEYIRHGLHWESWTSNFERILSAAPEGMYVSLQIAINAMSVTSLEDYLRFAKAMYDKYKVPMALRRTMVAAPYWQSPFVLTPEFAPYLDRAANFVESIIPDVQGIRHPMGLWEHYPNFLQRLAQSIRNGSSSAHARERFREWFLENDRKRNSSFLQVFPEYERFFNSACVPEGPHTHSPSL